MADVPVEPRTASSQSTEPQENRSPQETICVSRTWNPLIVPRELYLREGLSWQPHQPVSLTVEVNGKRDLMKYAAVMQMEPKMGFVARLGHPGAAAKFQNLHLVNVRRIGRNDIHICLGDLAWTQARAGLTLPALTPAVLPSFRNASPGVSEAGMAPAPEACVLGGGAATGGLLSGSSSEGISTGTDGVGSMPAIGTDMDAGASSDSRSQGDVASDTDEKATITSAAGESGGTQTSCSVAAPAASVGAVASDIIGVARSLEPARRPPASTVHPLLCGCMFCPCHAGVERLSAASSDQHLIASPHASVIAGRECVSKAGTQADRRMEEGAAYGAGVVTKSYIPSPTNGAPLSDASAGGSTSHLSYERLRNLALPPILKSASVANVLKAAALGPSDDSRPNGSPTATELQGTASGTTAASDTQVDDGMGCVIDGQIIDRELLLPPALAAKRMSDTHVLVQVEIDCEVEDCKIQFRLAKTADGQTLTLQGISRPLRGLQLISISEAGDGNIFIKAKTPSLLPSVLASALSPDATAAKARSAAIPSAAAGSTGVPMNGAAFFGRSLSGRQRRPSLKLREGAEEAALAGAYWSGAAANVSNLLPLYSSTCEAALRGELASAPPQQSQHLAKRRGSRATPTQRVPAAAAALLLLPAKAKTGQMQDCQNGYNIPAHVSNGDTKWEQPGIAKRRASPSCMTPDENVSGKGKGDEVGVLQLGERQLSSKRSRRGPAVGALLPPLAMISWPPPTAANAGTSARVTFAETGRSRWASNDLSGASLYPEEGPSIEGVSSIEMVLANVSGEDVAKHHQQIQEQNRLSANLRTTLNAIGRGCRKRSLMLPGVEAAVPAAAVATEVFLSEQLVGYSVKQRNARTRDTFQGARAIDVGGEGCKQQQELYLRGSQQGSEAAVMIMPGDPAARERNAGSRGVARRAQQLQLPQQPFPSSDSDGAKEAEDPAARGDSAAEAMADTGISDAYGAVAAEGSDPATADAQKGPDAGAAPRQKMRGRANVSKAKGKPNRHPSKISNVIRNAGAILLMIGVGSSRVVYEKQLRVTFGNNPDTSKALRLLEEQGKVKREGLGYRMHPYHYTLTPAGRNEYERLLDEAGPSYSFASSMGVRLTRRSVLPAAAEGLADCDSACAEEGGDAGTLTATAALGRTTPAMEVETEGSGEVHRAAAMAPAELLRQQGRQPRGSSAVVPSNSAQPCGTRRGVVFNYTSSSASVKHPAVTGGAGARSVMAAECAAAATATATALATAQAEPHPLSPLRRAAAAGTGGTGPASVLECPGLTSSGGMDGCSCSAKSPDVLSMPAVILADATIGSPAGHQQSGAQHGQLQPIAADSPKQVDIAGKLSPGTTMAHALFTCPMGFQLSYAPIYNLPSPEAAAGQLQRDSAAHESGRQMPSSNPYAPCSFVPTPFGYMPFPVYSPYATAATGATGCDNSAPGQVVGAPAPLTTISGVQTPTGLISKYGACGKSHTADACHSIASATVAAMAAKAPLVPPTPAIILSVQPAAQPQIVEYTIPGNDAGGVEHNHGHHPKGVEAWEQVEESLAGTMARATSALLPLPQSPALPAPSQPPALVSTTLSVAATPVPSHLCLPQPLSDAQQIEDHNSPDMKPPQREPLQQQELKQQPHVFRYVVKLAGGRYRAEVPSASGVMYYSPSFAEDGKAAAAADLLMAKLGPGEKLNFGFSEQEGEALASLTVDQVQAMLWCMTDSQ